MRPHGRQTISARKPLAGAICDRCGARYAHRDLRWQYEWTGPRMQNLKFLVCERCYDTPQEQLRLIVLPADPIPIENPRPEAYVTDMNGGYPTLTFQGFTSPSNVGTNLGGGMAALGFDPVTSFMPPTFKDPGAGSRIGNMTLGGGRNAAFDGSYTKPFAQCAQLANSNSSYQNTIGIFWGAYPGLANNVRLPAELGQQGLVAPGFAISGIVIQGPYDQPIFRGGATNFLFQGSLDGQTWTTLTSGATQGLVNEQVVMNSSQFTSLQSFGWHQLVLQGDGLSPIGLAQLTMIAMGQNIADNSGSIG